MIMEMLYEIGKGTCRYCGEPIVHLRGEWGGTHWSHEETGKRTCAGAPEAEPV